MPKPRTLVGAWREMRQTWHKQQEDPTDQYDTAVPTRGRNGGAGFRGRLDGRDCAGRAARGRLEIEGAVDQAPSAFWESTTAWTAPRCDVSRALDPPLFCGSMRTQWDLTATSVPRSSLHWEEAMKHLLRATVASAAILGGALITTASVAAEHEETIRIIMITHAAAGDEFWAPVKKGAEDAAELIGATLSYQAPQGGADLVAMNNLIRAATAQEPDGLVVAVTDVDALGPAIRAAVDAGIPAVSINLGVGTQEQTGSMFFVGEDLYEAGVISGKRLKELGGTKAVCFNLLPGNILLDAICSGLDEGFGGSTSTVPSNWNPADVAAKTRAVLETDPDVDTILSMSTTNAPTIADTVEEMGLEDKILHSTFNLSGEVLEDIRDGRIAFTIDQQPYLQGYLPVIALNLKARYGIQFIVDHIGSGPLVIDASNAADVLEQTKRGYR